MKKNKDRLALLETEKVPKALLFLAFPSILSALVSTIYNMVDTVFIGQLQVTAMIAATTVSMPIMVIIQAFGEAIGVSASSFISRQLGANRPEQVKKIVQTTMTLALLLSIVIPLIIMIFLNPILSIFGAEGDVVSYASQYVSVLIIFSFTLIVKLIAGHLLRAEGDVQFPLYAIFAGVVANIILDPIFMFDWGLNMGIAGAAWATVAAQFISTVLLVWRLSCKAKYVRWNPFDLKLDWSIIKDIASLGSAVFARQALPSISYSCLAIAAGHYSTDFIAGIGLAKKAQSLVMFAILGFSQGFLPFAAYNYGAGNKKRLNQALKLSLIMTTSYCLLMVGVFLGFGSQIIGIFTQDAAVIQIGVYMLWGYCASFPVLGLYNVMAILLQALGKSRESFFLSTARQGLFYVPIILILPLIFQEIGIYAAQPLADYLTIIALFFLTRNLRKELS